MKKIRCLLPLLLLALFTGCTLMIDEPETATTPQETENGDGITSPRRLVSDMGEVRYQIGSETRMIDKDYLPYLLTYKTDTLDRVTEIYFNKSIPLELLPQRGEFLATDQADAIPNGLVHQVNLVRTTDNGYTVEVSPASYKDVYKVFDFVTDFDIIREPVNRSNAYGFWQVASDEPEYEYKLRGTYLNPLAKAGPYLSDESSEREIPLLTLYLGLKNGNYKGMFKKYVKHDPKWDYDPLGGKKLINPYLDGEIDLYASANLYAHVFSETRTEDQYSETWLSLEYDLKCGFGGQEATAGMTFPIMGNRSWETILWNSQRLKRMEIVKDLYQRPISRINTEDYWIPLDFPEHRFILYGVPCSVGLSGAFTIDFYGFLKMARPFSLETGMKGTLFKIGYVKNAKETYFLPKSGETVENSPKTYTETPFNEISSLGIGVRPNMNIGVLLRVAELLKLELGPSISFPMEYSWDFVPPRNVVDFAGWTPKDINGKKLGYAGNSGLYVTPTIGLDIKGTLDAKIWEIPLLEWKSPRWTFWDGSWRANPKIKVDKIYPIPDKSNADSTCYYATVKTENVTFLDTPNGVPELYIYNRYHDDGKRVTCIGHENENFDSKATYEYEFYLPKVYIDEFYYATPVVDGKFYDPEKFTRFGNTLEIKNIERVQITGTGNVLSEGEEAVGVKLNLKGKVIDQCSSLELIAFVKDQQGRQVSGQTFYLDVPQFGKEYVKNLLFVIAYTDSPPGDVTFALRYYDAELKDHVLSYKTFEFSDYDFSGDDLDLDDMKKWTKKGYELLQ